MSRTPLSPVPMRRTVLRAAWWGVSWSALGLSANALAAPSELAASNDGQAEDGYLIEQLFARTATPSPRVRLELPAVFANGYSVPLTLAVDAPMTEADHVRVLHVLAPKNPIIAVAKFQFSPASGRAAVSTRIRLAQSQAVLAVADMSDGTLLMARRWVEVDTDGCK